MTYMKEEFSGFYGLEEEEVENLYRNKETVFIFDTNILLNLYRCEKKTRDTFISIWKSMKEQVWVPYHVILEYQRNRIQSIEDNVNDLDSIPKELELKTIEIFNNLKNSKSSTISRYSELNKEIEKLEEKVIAAVKLFKTNQIEKIIDFIDLINKKDVVRESLDGLLSNRIGKAPSQDEIDNINNKGKQRYKIKTGPGFSDEKEKSKLENYNFNGIEYTPMFGDLYIWQEILDYVKNNQLKNVIWVSNDLKKDFIYITNRNKKRGAREDLRTEMKINSGCQNFTAHSIKSFLHHINKVSTIKMSEKAISELIQTGRVSISDSYFISLNEPYEIAGVLTRQFKGLSRLAHKLKSMIVDLNEKIKTHGNDGDYIMHLSMESAEIEQNISDVNKLLLKVVSLQSRFNESYESDSFKKEFLEFFKESSYYIKTAYNNDSQASI